METMKFKQVIMDFPQPIHMHAQIVPIDGPKPFPEKIILNPPFTYLSAKHSHVNKTLL